jgi:hypothetical protein
LNELKSPWLRATLSPKDRALVGFSGATIYRHRLLGKARQRQENLILSNQQERAYPFWSDNYVVFQNTAEKCLLK